jgi:hypothetical protein
MQLQGSRGRWPGHEYVRLVGEQGRLIADVCSMVIPPINVDTALLLGLLRPSRYRPFVFSAVAVAIKRSDPGIGEMR